MSLTDALARTEVAGSGTVGPFTCLWRIVNEADIEVIKVVSSVATTLVLNTDYTVDDVGEDNFTVTLTVALATGESLFVLRNQPLEQTSEYTNEVFPPTRFNRDLDKIWMALQQHSEQFLRTLVMDKHATVESLFVEAPTNGLFLKYDSGQGKFVWATPTNAGALSSPVGVADGGTGAATASGARTNLGLATISQSEAEAGTGTTERAWTAERVKQAIAAQAPALDTMYLAGKDTTVRTTTGAEADAATITLTTSIPTTDWIIIRAQISKSSGAAAGGKIGLKLNSTVIQPAASQLDCFSSANQSESGTVEWKIGPRNASITEATGLAIVGSASDSKLTQLSINPTQRPNASVTTVAVRFQSGSASVTVSLINVYVYGMRG